MAAAKVFVLILAVTGVAVAEDVDGLQPDLFDGERNVTFQNGSSYSGHWQHGIMHGDGILQLASGDIYKLFRHDFLILIYAYITSVYIGVPM
jgi:hypothetical protein